MKKITFAILLSVFTLALSTQTTSCKTLAKSAVKHWSKKQTKKFLTKCKEGTVAKFGDKASDICSCVANIAEEKYPKIEDAMNMSSFELIKLAMKCK